MLPTLRHIAPGETRSMAVLSLRCVSQARVGPGRMDREAGVRRPMLCRSGRDAEMRRSKSSRALRLGLDDDCLTEVIYETDLGTETSVQRRAVSSHSERIRVSDAGGSPPLGLYATNVCSQAEILQPGWAAQGRLPPFGIPSGRTNGCSAAERVVSH